MVNVISRPGRSWIRGEDREAAGSLVDLSEPADRQNPCNSFSMIILDSLVPSDVKTLPLVKTAVNRVVRLKGSFKVASLRVFWTDEGGNSHFTNDCEVCGHKIVEVARRTRFSVKFMCNPAHRIGGRRSEEFPSFFTFSDFNDQVFKVPLEIRRPRGKTIK